MLFNLKDAASYISAKREEYTAKELKEILKDFKDFVMEQVADGNTVTFDDFGKFVPKYVAPKGEKEGRNPKTKETVVIPPCPEFNKYSFKVSPSKQKLLKEKTLGDAYKK